nr:MAG TPA: hypothetical protein [Caudoviricetes sp.]
MNKFEFVWECELDARFDSRASFYRKAMVKLFNHNGKEHYRLYSYETLVMIIEKNVDTGENKVYRLEDDDLYSNTTTRYCREFAKQFADIDQLTKKDLLKLPIWNED